MPETFRNFCICTKIHAIFTVAAQQSIIVKLVPLSVFFDAHCFHYIALKHTQLRLKRHFRQFIFLCILVSFWATFTNQQQVWNMKGGCCRGTSRNKCRYAQKPQKVVTLHIVFIYFLINFVLATHLDFEWSSTDTWGHTDFIWISISVF